MTGFLVLDTTLLMVAKFLILIYALCAGALVHGMCDENLAAKQPSARFNTRVTVRGETLYFDDRQIDKPYYVDGQGNLFNKHGFEVVSIDNQMVFGGLQWRVGYERDAELFYNVKAGVTIRRGIGHTIGGVGFDGYLYVGEHRCTGHGPGFYIHKGRIRDRRGRTVDNIEYVGNGHCHIEVSSGWF